MRTRTLGSNGPAVSVIGLGCNNFGMTIDQDTARSVVLAALDAGITHFDTAESYGDGHSEEMLGRALDGRRDQVVVASKARRRPEDDPWRPGDLTRRIVEGCEGSLRRLGTDHIDVYYEHHRDSEAPLEEALAALDQLVTAGKVGVPACSNYSAADILTATDLCRHNRWVTPRAAQMHWNLVAREVESAVVPAARSADMGIVPYYPLASGLLTGKYRSDRTFPVGSRLQRLPRFAGVATPDNFATAARLVALAGDLGRTPAELAIAWLVAQPGVASVIVGATSPEQVQANAAAARWTPTDQDLALITEAGSPPGAS